MFGNNNWVKKEILPELKERSREKIKSYYYRRLNTAHENYAHVFLCEIKDENDLIENWNNIINLVAVYVQSEVENLLQRSNFYVWFFCGSKVSKSIRKRIEDDTYSSKKYIIVEESKKSDQERIEIVENKLFSYAYTQNEINSRMIQKVVMKNFRAYKGERVFNFSNGKEPARLIVMFAPNGMGKTSFFDGIEWTFTETIDRFGKIGNKSVEGVILKNTEADLKEEASVTIHMENGEWVKRKVSRLNNRTKRDTGKGNVSFSKGCSLKSAVGNNRTWSNLMLQHHKIDGFIAAASPQDLYKEWCGLWDPSGEERKYFEKSHKVLKDRKGELESAVKGYDEIKAEYEKVNQKRDFVERLVKDIREFNRLPYGNKLTVPDFFTITPGEYVKWSGVIDCQIDSCRAKNDKIMRAIFYVDTMLEEDIFNYKRLSEQKKAFDAELLAVKENIERCQKKKEVLALWSDLEKQKAEVEKELERLYLIYNDQEWYGQARSYFDALPKRAILQTSINDAKGKLSLLMQDQERLRVDIHNRNIAFKEQKEYKQLYDHLNEIKRLEKEKEELEVKIVLVEKEIDIKNGKISEYVLKQENFRKKYLKSFEDVILRYHTLNLQQEEEDDRLESIRVVIVRELQKYSKLEEEVKLIDQRIQGEENIGSRLRQILEDARKLIGEQKLKQCPVCHTLFDDSDSLIQNTYQIDSGEGESLKKQLEEQGKRLSEEKITIERFIEDYNLHLETIIAEIGTEIIYEKSLIEDIRKSCEEIQLQIDNKSNAISKIVEKDQGQGMYVVYSEEGIENWHANWSLRQKAEIELLEKQLEEADEKIVCQQEQMALLEGALKENEAVILNMESSSQEHFIIMQEEKSYITKYTYDELRNMVAEREKEKGVLSGKLEKCSMDLEVYKDVSETLQQAFVERKNALQDDIKSNSEEADLVAGRINRSALLSEKSEDLENIVSGDWKSKIKQIEEYLQHEQEDVTKAIEILSRMKYNKEIENYFWRNQEIAQQVKASEENKKRKEDEVEKAEREYQNSRDRIEDNLKRFFDGFHINDIYEKLEPHDTLKTLTCEFGFNEDDKPELTFKVVGKDEKQYAPEWYFSTAQLNVVAFSVFLGKALQTAEVPIQSIFIDDPVGHFDEMNVVCFVDLLRNIVENAGRQLIISTHEERVFGLIQRKLPKDEYPVCYIDFREDFGA